MAGPTGRWRAKERKVHRIRWRVNGPGLHEVQLPLHFAGNGWEPAEGNRSALRDEPGDGAEMELDDRLIAVNGGDLRHRRSPHAGASQGDPRPRMTS